jgi:hypothetical protein
MARKPQEDKLTMTSTKHLLPPEKKPKKITLPFESCVKKCVKKTSTPKLNFSEVRTASIAKNNQTCISPKLLTRKKPLRKTKTVAMLRLDTPLACETKKLYLYTTELEDYQQ